MLIAKRADPYGYLEQRGADDVAEIMGLKFNSLHVANMRVDQMDGHVEITVTYYGMPS